MAYTDIDNPELHFQCKIYIGNATDDTAITLDGDENMQPDWVWIKDRTNANHHRIYDSVRGATKAIYSSLTNAEGTASDGLKSFNSDGFTLGDGSDENGDSANLVSWCWKAGTSFSNDASSTSVGTIDSTGSVNTDAGFSIISYTGNGSTNQTIGHGLGVEPDFIIIKARSTTMNWPTYQKVMGNGVVFLDVTAAWASGSGYDNYWYTSGMTSSTFGISNNINTNTSGATYIAYCFADVKGYSKFGSYVGNGNADGPFIYTGFKPAWVMGKKTDGAEDWFMFDNKRDAFNLTQKKLRANSNAAENDNSAKGIDLLSNGFKLRTSNGEFNGSGGNWIYMAFAENPFVSSTGVPATAR